MNMAEIELLFSTGDPVVDRVMRGWIAAFEAAFPWRVRCFTVAGGYAEGTATPLSDIDGGPVFRSDPPLSTEEFWRAHALNLACRDLSRIFLDTGVGVEDRHYRYCDTGDVWAARGELASATNGANAGDATNATHATNMGDEGDPKPSTGAESWLPAELAGWLLERSPDDVQTLGTSGVLPSEMRDGRRLFAARPCLERWAAAMLGRVLYPGDTQVADTLASLTQSDVAIVRDTAQASLEAVHGVA